MNDFPVNNLLPPNLVKLGVPRATSDSIPDLTTIWNTPYPVITRYKCLCADLGILPFAGGDLFNQGEPYKVGYITSGYRANVIDGNEISPHHFAIALDIVIGDIKQQIEVSKIALRYFNRIGIYPENGIIHVDLATPDWIKHYRKKRFWVKRNSVYMAFDKYKDMIVVVT